MGGDETGEGREALGRGGEGRGNRTSATSYVLGCAARKRLENCWSGRLHVNSIGYCSHAVLIPSNSVKSLKPVLLTWGTAAAVSPPFRHGEPAFCGSHHPILV